MTDGRHHRPTGEAEHRTHDPAPAEPEPGLQAGPVGDRFLTELTGAAASACASASAPGSATTAAACTR
jgi:hypothetical protein